MNVINVFFPTQQLRDRYMEKIFELQKCWIEKRKNDDFSYGIYKIHFKRFHKNIPGYWVKIAFCDSKENRKLQNNILKLIPPMWQEENIFFPMKMTSIKEMEKLWREKYHLDLGNHDSDAWKILFKEIQLHFQQGRADIASRALIFIYKNNPYFLKKYKRYYILEDLAYYYESQGALHKSIKLLKMQAKLQPDSSEAYLNMSSFLIMNGLNEEAIKVCSKGLELQPENEYLSNNLLVAYLNEDNVIEAFDHINERIKKNPNVSSNWKLMGDIFSEVQDIEAAIDCYLEAIEIGSEDFEEIQEDIYYSLGMCYQYLGKIRISIRYFKKILLYNPQDTTTLLNLSKLYGEDLKKYSRAQYYAEKLVRCCPENGYGHHNLGLIYLYTNNIEKAKWHLYKARRLLPEYPPVQNAIDELKKMKKHSPAQ